LTLFQANTPAYSWEDPNNLCSYDWQSGTVRNSGTAYDSEHVLEWQLVTGFFAKLNEKGGTKYVHPDPLERNKTVDFCTYWIESWSLEGSQGFSIKGSPNMDPWSHVAAAYPSNSNFKSEMVALQRNINSPAKANVSFSFINIPRSQKDADIL
jgi:hypothetical protein